LAKAQNAIDEGNWDEAIAAYQELIEVNPSDSLARIGLLNVELFKRLDGVDFDATLANAPRSVEAQLLAADCEFMLNDWSSAFSRLILVVRDSSGADRDLAKVRLLELFEIAGPHDAAVVKARIDLTSALF
jgi:putative thioredoxin